MSGHFPSGRSRVRAFSFWTQLGQSKWHPDDACHGTVVTLAVKARNIAANTHVAFTNTQRVPGIVTQSSLYGKDVHGKTASTDFEHQSQFVLNSVVFFLFFFLKNKRSCSRLSSHIFFISNVHLYMLLPHFAFPAQAPSVTSIAAVFDARSISLSVGNKGKLANTTRRDEHDVMSTTR